jgi:cation transport regulator ChaC
MWVFGYGSLIWKPNFRFVEKRAAFITGYIRRFWQGSTDHRGTHERPGRVVTLIPTHENADKVVGVAFKLDPETEEETLRALDVREQGGYDRVMLVAYAYDTGFPLPERCLCFIANEQNQEWLGPAPVMDIAWQICECAGPSGSNLEYFENLAASLRDLGAFDEHISELEGKIQAIQAAACRSDGLDSSPR